VNIYEIGPTYIAEKHGLFPEPSVITLPGDHFGYMLGIDVTLAEIEHLHVALKGNHFVGYDFHDFFGIGFPIFTF
jgi:hypothetical protein